MAVASRKDFLDILLQSRLLPAAAVDDLRGQGDETADPRPLAKELAEDGRLTAWQARNLLAGRSRMIVGGHRLLDLISNSDTGGIYLAECLQSGRRPALKMLARALIADPRRTQAFLDSWQKVARVSHEHIARMYEVKREGERVFVLIERIRGKDVETHVGKHGPLGFEQAADIVRQTALALAAAHEAGVIHGDVRPANIMLDDAGNVKLLGLGLRPLLPNGHCDYAAPELDAAGAEVDGRADVYSLGATLYFLLTGAAPFPEGDEAAKRRQHREAMPQSLLDTRPETPPDLMKLCIRMMAKEPQHRFESAAVVAETMASWLETHAPLRAFRQRIKVVAETMASWLETHRASGGDQAPAPASEDAAHQPPASASRDDTSDVDAMLAAAMAGREDATGEPTMAQLEDKQESESDVDDALADMLAASEFDSAIREGDDEPPAPDEKPKASKGLNYGVGAGGGKLAGKKPATPLSSLDDEPDEPIPSKAPSSDETDASADAAESAGEVRKIFGIELKEGDKRPYIVGGAVGGVVVLALLWFYVIPFFFGGDGGNRRRTAQGPPPAPATQPVAPAEGSGESDPGQDGAATDGTGETEPDDGASGGEGSATNGDSPTDSTGGATDGDDGPTPPTEPTPGADGGETAGGANGATGEGEGGGEDPPAPVVHFFADMPTVVALPKLGTSTEEVVLGPVDLSPEASLSVKLLGGDVVGDISFFFRRSETGEAGPPLWRLLARKQGGANEPLVAKLWLREGQLVFQWEAFKADSPFTPLLDVVRSCVLELAVEGAEPHRMALRQPQPLPPLVVKLLQDSMAIQSSIDAAPPAASLKIEFTGVSEEFPEVAYDPSATIPAMGGKTIMRLSDKDGALVDIAISTAEDASLAITLAPTFDLARTYVGAGDKAAPTVAAIFREQTLKLYASRTDGALAENRANLGAVQERLNSTPSSLVASLTQKKQELEAALAAIEADVEKMNRLIDLALALHDKATIAYRVVAVYGDATVEIAATIQPEA